MSSSAQHDDTMDVVKDELDVKDELEPIVGSSTDLLTTEFKDEFSEETETDPLNQSAQEDPEKVSIDEDQDKGSTDDQDTEGDSINDVEEVEEDIQEHQEEEEGVVEETELLTTHMETDEPDPLDDPLMAGDDPLDDQDIDPMDNGTEDCLADVEGVEGDDILEEVDGGEEVAVDEQNVEGVDPLDPLAGGAAAPAAGKTGGTKRKSDQTDKTGEVAVRKSSRIKQNQELKKSEKENSMLQGKSVHDAQKEKLKMLQKPTERPTRLNTDDEQSESEKTSDTEKEEEVLVEAEESAEAGDRSRPPGADATRKIDQDFLLPFRFGWTREVVIRPGKTGPPQIDIFYWPPKGGPDHGTRNREARRKRRSKVDQERYFEEFKSSKLSVNNFSYVRRPLDLNNEAYEIIRRNSKPSLETRSDRTRAGKVASYKEVAEHEGLLSGDESDEDKGEDDADIQDITEFDQGLPLSLQIMRKVTPLREESKKRRKFPNRERCITPPLAEDLPWTLLDDDPLGIYTELGGRSSPATPPPLRAVRLTSHPTHQSINTKMAAILADLVDPLARITEANRDLDLKENLASHDTAIKKFKNFRPNPLPTPHRTLQPGRQLNRQGVPRPNQPIRQQQANQNRTSTPGYVKVRLPMLSTNGKRPVVELVMLTNGKYQPIKFTNNRQVTESIPKRLFDQATGMRKTLYQRSVQVPKIGTKQVFIAINPSPAGSRPFNGNLPQQQQQQQQPQRPQQKTVLKSPGVSEQVSILVRPAQGGNAVLLNVPRHVALKVKIGTTLSFSASNEQKYTVIDNKMHPPVGKSGSGRPPPPQPQRPPQRPLPSLPAGVSIRPINRRPVVRPQFGRTPPQSAVKQMQNKARTPPGLVRNSVSNFTPCSPFCPGVTGIPELECSSCHSLFHPVCVGIPQSRIHQIQNAFRCKACSNRPGGGGGGGPAPIQVIDLD